MDRSLAGYSRWGCKQLDRAERLTLTLVHTSGAYLALNLTLFLLIKGLLLIFFDVLFELRSTLQTLQFLKILASYLSFLLTTWSGF